jgi:hypothetical protein
MSDRLAVDVERSAVQSVVSRLRGRRLGVAFVFAMLLASALFAGHAQAASPPTTGTPSVTISSTAAATGAGGFDLASSAGRLRLAARLMRLDPGKQLGGNTQVGTGAGQHLLGVPGRVNFIMALGPHEVIVGGAGHDELGALGDSVTIYGGAGPDLIHAGPGKDRLDGGPGNDLIYGGAGNDVIDGGPGNDVIYANKRGHTTVFPGSGTNQINVADGHGGDRVVCAAGSTNRITADHSDRIASSCRRKGSTVRYVRLPSARASARAAQTTGPPGSDGNPYTAECNPLEPPLTDCKVALWQQSLSGLWTHAAVPALQCPASHPWTVNYNYAPFGTSVPPGVDVAGLGPVGISIIHPLTNTDNFFTGSETEDSSVTNWTTGTNTYTIYLHCTHNTDERGGYSS